MDYLFDYLDIKSKWRSGPQQRPAYVDAPKETDQKIQSIFSKTKTAFRSFQYSLATNLNRLRSALSFNIFSGKKLTNTHNAGRPEDSSIYAKQKSVSVENTTLFTKNGYGKENMTLVPSPTGGGKCTGGVNLFLKKALEKPKNIEDVAQEFKSGIPFEGIYGHTLYTHLNATMDGLLLEAWSQIEKQNLSLKNLSTIQNPENPRIGYILSAYVAYLKSDQNTDLITWIDEQLENDKLDKLQPAEKTALFEIDSQFRYGTGGQERLALLHNDLQIEPKIPEIITQISNSPQSVTNQIDDLKPGAYKLGFPVFDKWGETSGISHTVGFVIKEDGSTVFYDPNYSITAVTKDKRKEAVEKVFSHYTGWSPSGTNSAWQKIKNFWNGHSAPKNSEDLRGFELLKLTKV